ncbi:MAG: 8-amino-7-oxononanoate synthase [Gammaproteobacteria bacterium]|nr:8-amino-7-oxononanoate synthase [Gammaproteobacteria bacterium]
MATLPWSEQLANALSERKTRGRYRQQRVRSGQQGVDITLDGQRFLSFCSNDYLGLANHPALKKAFIDSVERDGVGSGAAHLLTGHSCYHDQLEQALADFTGHQRALLFSSGYQANLGVIDGLMARDDVIIQDKLNHASLLDGGRLSPAKQLRYQHNDMTALARRLTSTQSVERKLIVSDAVFSMDGDIAPLADIMDLANTYQAGVVIDDAHGFGVLGQTGRGSIEHWQLSADNLPIVVGTFGKAFGTAGAFVAADNDVIETLIQQARSYVYTTAQPAAVAAATLASLKLVQTETWRRDTLQALIAQFRQGAEQLGLELMQSFTAIQPVVIGDDQKAIQIGKALEQKGLLVGVIRPPTVPEGSARLRITLSANHTQQHVVQLLDALEQILAH